MRISWIGLAAAMTLALTACDDKKPAAASPAEGSATAAKDTASAEKIATTTKKAAASAKKAPVGDDELTAVCEKMCEKMSACAEEMTNRASGAVRKGKLDTDNSKGARAARARRGRALETAKAEAGKAAKVCKSTCASSTKEATAAERAEAPAIKTCLAKPCAEFAKCIAEVAK